MKTSDVLKKALLKIKKGWCQGALARSRNGRKVCVLSKRAVKFCSSGAVMAITIDPHKQYLAWATLKSIINQAIVPYWNDDPARTKKEVIEAFKKAIKLAEEKEKEQCKI